MGGKSKPVTFTLAGDGGSIAGSATVKQSDWGIKPYSALFGALKVNDEVTVEVKGNPGVSAAVGPARGPFCGAHRESAAVGEAVAHAPSAGRAARELSYCARCQAVERGRADPGKERDCAGIGTIRVLLSERREPAPLGRQRGDSMGAYRAVFLRVHPTGKCVLSLTGTADGQERQLAQIVTNELGIPLDDTEVVQTDYDRFGDGHGFLTAGSAGTANAVSSVCRKIRDKAQLLAGGMLGTSPGPADVGQRRLVSGP